MVFSSNSISDSSVLQISYTLFLISELLQPRQLDIHIYPCKQNSHRQQSMEFSTQSLFLEIVCIKAQIPQVCSALFSLTEEKGIWHSQKAMSFCAYLCTLFLLSSSRAQRDDFDSKSPSRKASKTCVSVQESPTIVVGLFFCFRGSICIKEKSN